jgi:hypothetical protein
LQAQLADHDAAHRAERTEMLASGGARAAPRLLRRTTARSGSIKRLVAMIPPNRSWSAICLRSIAGYFWGNEDD